MRQDVVLRADHGPVRVIRLNRPDKHNALNTELTTALLDELLAADAASSVRAVVLAGEGRSFCSGADITEFAELTPGNQDAVVRRADLTARTQLLPQQLSKPIVSVVWGNALGGGAGLAIGCDMMVVTDDVRFGYPELKHSLVPAIVMTGLQRQIGRKLAFEMISHGRLLGAAELVRLGLANRCVARAEALDAGIEIATRWSEPSMVAMAATKDLFYRVADLPVEQAMRAGRDVNAIMRGFRG